MTTPTTPPAVADGLDTLAGSCVEWRVTGQPDDSFPPFEFVWSLANDWPTRSQTDRTTRFFTPRCGDPEKAARAFIANAKLFRGRPWKDGPHLSGRTVTMKVTEWEDK